MLFLSSKNRSSLKRNGILMLAFSQSISTRTTTVNALSSTSTSTSTTTTTAKPTLNKTASPIVSNKKVPGLKNGMDYTYLGSSDLLVSKICMGTMTFGNQNTIEEGVEQLNMAFEDYGINFLDTAEMYPVPTTPETQGLTDKTVCEFLKQGDSNTQRRKREDVILATKVAGRSERMTWLRKEEKPAVVNREQILESVDRSLDRLGTDYIDLLQIHWPDRYVPMFGSPDFNIASIRDDATSFEEQLSALKEVIDAGKVKHVGLSNETPWGVSQFMNLAKQEPDLYAKIVSIQNSYSLVNRKDFEAGLAEMCYYNKVGFLPYSPLSGGVLTGKYNVKNPDDVPEGARMKLFPGFMDRYIGSRNSRASEAYAQVAKDQGLTPVELALSWCYHREHVCSTIIGATSMEQLKEDLNAYDTKLDDETIKKINEVYADYIDPTKRY